MEKYQIKGADATCMINKFSKDIGSKIDEYSTKLRKAKKKNTPENILLVVLVAGHGLLMSGNQALLHREIEPKTGFLKEFAVEKKMR